MMEEYNTTIVTIGDEILIGQIIDSNSAWLADKLFHLGFCINEIRSISDTPYQIEQTLDELTQKSNLIILTGGLGPTSDDLTKQVLNDFFEGSLITDENVLNDIKEFAKRKKERDLFTDNNIAQALVSNNATVLRNPIGTAPGQLFKKNNCIIISLPGVPFEMKSIFNTSVIKELHDNFQLTKKTYKTFHITGYYESELSNILTQWEYQQPDTIKIAYLPSPGIIRLRISDSTNNALRLETSIAALKHIIGKNIIAEDKERVEEILGKLLKNKRLTISVAESCTGGLIAHKFTSIEGASLYFKGSITAYNNEAKINLLAVNSLSIDKYGAVSESVVKQMSEGCAKTFKTDIGIATTGIAGPGGGTPEKPVGTVWIGIYINGEVYTYLYHFTHSRQLNIERTSTITMYKVIEHII